MTKSLAVRLLVATWLLVPAACGGTGSSTATTPTPTPVLTPTPAPVVKTASATVDGKSQTILVDSKGMTLYYFTPDKGGKVTCSGGCLATWPPLLLPSDVSKATGDKGVTGTLSTIANPDGKGTQILYNTWPLYNYAKDKTPGDTTGQNVNGKWFVVPPDLAPGT